MSITVSKTSDIESCLILRRIVFIEEQGVSEEEELDSYDPIAVHFLAWDGTEPVGTARLLYASNIGKIGRVCVLKPYRSLGLGAVLINAAIDCLRLEVGLSFARLGAQVDAVGFYEKLGFRVISGEYMDAGIPHVDMEYTL